MQALVQAGAGALQREFLLASAEIQRAHRRVAVLRLEQESLRGFPRRAERDRLGLVPAAEAVLDTGSVANDNQVERIALDRPVRVTGAPRLPFNPDPKSLLVELFGASRGFHFRARMGQDETGHLDGELEIEGVAAAKQAHIDPFHAFIQPRENEPAGFLPRDDHPAWEA